MLMEAKWIRPAYTSLFGCEKCPSQTCPLSNGYIVEKRNPQHLTQIIHVVSIGRRADDNASAPQELLVDGGERMRLLLLLPT